MELLPLHFIRPWWLLAIPLAIAVPLAWRHLRRPSGDWARVCDPHLLRWLSVGEHSGKPGRLGSWAAGLVLALSALALSGPSWQRLPDASYSSMDARVLVLDLSASMLAQDLKPDRLTQVRYRLSDILAETQEGQVGMVAYAGDAYVVAPLTSDTNTIANMLPALRPDIMPMAGSRADRGMELAAELLRRSGHGSGEILLITDSVSGTTVDLAARLAVDGIVTSVLAVGTRAGAPIPSGNGFVSDASGNVVIARTLLDELRSVAEAGNGRLSRLSAETSGDLPWRAGEGEEFGLRDDGLGERWSDAGIWLVLALLPLAVLGFRRGVLFLLPLALLPGLFVSQPAQAGLWNDLWQRKDQQAQQALRDEKPGEAAGLAKDPAIAGEAWYRSGEYQRAAQQWNEVSAADAHFNRGNALAHAGDLDAAIAAYDQALSMAPEMEDALYNRALVEQLKEQQQQQQESEDQSGEGEQQEGEPTDSDQQGEAGEEDQEGQQQEGEGEPQDQESQEGQQGEQGEQQMAQAWSEEDAQAMEQWLRRIPDDPGGLLRRKFRNEHQRRGAPASEKETW
jgi:Ca-activated chloride channel family protein